MTLCACTERSNKTDLNQALDDPQVVHPPHKRRGGGHLLHWLPIQKQGGECSPLRMPKLGNTAWPLLPRLLSRTQSSSDAGKAPG